MNRFFRALCTRSHCNPSKILSSTHSWAFCRCFNLDRSCLASCSTCLACISSAVPLAYLFLTLITLLSTFWLYRRFGQHVGLRPIFKKTWGIKVILFRNLTLWLFRSFVEQTRAIQLDIEGFLVSDRRLIHKPWWRLLIVMFTLNHFWWDVDDLSVFDHWLQRSHLLPLKPFGV